MQWVEVLNCFSNLQCSEGVYAVYFIGSSGMDWDPDKIWFTPLWAACLVRWKGPTLHWYNMWVYTLHCIPTQRTVIQIHKKCLSCISHHCTVSDWKDQNALKRGASLCLYPSVVYTLICCCYICVYQRNAARQANVTKYWNLQLSHSNMIKAVMIIIKETRPKCSARNSLWFWRQVV